MKLAVFFVLILLCGPSLFGQTPASGPPGGTFDVMLGAGGSYNHMNHPQGSALLFAAKKIVDGTISFNVCDVLFSRNAAGKLQAETTFQPGLAQYVKNTGPLEWWILATAGPAMGVKIGFSWLTGTAVYAGLGKGLGLLGALRAVSAPDPASQSNTLEGIFSLSLCWGNKTPAASVTPAIVK